MKNCIFIILFLMGSLVFSQDSENNKKEEIKKDTLKKEKAFAIVPLITSTPLMGVGVGVTTSYLYKADQTDASKSQMRIGGQYTSTKSYSVFGVNNLWLKDNNIRMLTTVNFSSVNNEFEDEGKNVEYNINTTLVTQLQMFRVANNFYAGMPLHYKNLKYKANNTEGGEFLEENGIEDEQTGGFGFAGSFDTRKNKYYPTNSVFITARFDMFPEFLGSDRKYNKTIIDARGYIDGFSFDDVLAMQVYGEFSSYYAPDAGLPSISGKAILRGFPHGQFKARSMTGGQAEYRYTIGQSRFRLTSFFGVANLNGGSYGDGVNSRNDDGWYNAAGVGLRYKIQQVTGVDVRLDFVRTSENEYSAYLKLNQAF